jgi:hypothetical protein
MLWLRPDEPAWDEWRGNTYTDELLRLRVTERMSVRWLPWNLRQLGLYIPPRITDLMPIRLAELHGPWHELIDEPFDLPSLVVARRGFDSPLDQSRYALLPTDRAALSALAVRHQSTDTGFVSEYVPVRFEGQGQLDLADFAFTVMLDRTVPKASDQQTLVIFNDIMSLWAFGGVDRKGRVHAELWRGELDRAENDTVYRFSRLGIPDGPGPRGQAVLLADIVGQRLVLLGGRSAQGLLDEVWTLDLADQAWFQRDTRVPSSLGLIASAAQTDGRYAYLYGGTAARGGAGRVLWRLDLWTLMFERLSDPWQPGPGPRVGASMTLDAEDDVLYLHGGSTPGRGWRNDLWAFDLHRRQWRRLADDCQPGDGCPPPAEGSTLLSSGTPGAVTLALGSPMVAWDRAEHEWRFVLSQGRWYPEDELRGSWAQQPEPPPPPPSDGWCLSAAAGRRGSLPTLPVILIMLVVAVALARRRRP